MRITEVETFALKVPIDDTSADTGYGVRGPRNTLYSPRRETLLVRVTAEDGTTGWGEGLAPVAPEVVAGLVDVLLGPVLIGMDATRPRPTRSLLADLMRVRGHLVGHQADALAAVDTALWDLAGRIAGCSVAQLLGGAFRTEVPAYVSGVEGATDDERADQAREWVTRGAQAVKLHLGGGVETDLATVDAVMAAAPSLRVAVDAHWAYSVTDALRLARGLEERGGWFLEAPLAPEDLGAHAFLVDHVALPIAIGEPLRNRYEFAQWLDAPALRIAQPDCGRTGISETMVIADLCATRNVPLAPHHSVGLGVAVATGLQVAAAVEQFAVFEYQVATMQVASSILIDPIRFDPSGFTLPDGPGLGVEVDVDAVRRLASSSR
ncbi:mandelate racemase/muconate lactonizing enzyme family protein [Jiangella alkaliphila]|uniref:L-alanine-DL-glutamate epimerase n=1 Tax=Jiangella alkaliphila TaxID=419479 RepID=A0A1H2LCA7_9ACTN|nr:mandelate racemase/muconate lactonizing enzyme family protein [Jiangella alkaliphila]SDU78211.1 L-alanine-DL-glutamate epimerase [Jiangella alkaliphila]